MKTIRFVNDYMYSRKGDVIEEGDGVAEILIARRIAEEVPAGVAVTEPGAGPEGPRVTTVRVTGPREHRR